MIIGDEVGDLLIGNSSDVYNGYQCKAFCPVCYGLLSSHNTVCFRLVVYRNLLCMWNLCVPNKSWKARFPWLVELKFGQANATGPSLCGWEAIPRNPLGQVVLEKL